MQANIDSVKEIFNTMVTDGFNVNEPLKWGFFFFDSNKSKLYNLYEELKEHGYEINEFVQMDDTKWRLYVTKCEVLSPEKLHKRNIAFNQLAEYCSVELYDGWDVEKM